MLTRRIIPCLDVRHGRVVKGVRFGNLQEKGDPAELAAEYERQGADEIVLLDIVATAEARAACLRCVANVRQQLSIPLTVGGGVRASNDVESLLCAGADRVALNSAAVSQPELLSDLAQKYGNQCIVVAIDAAKRGVDQWEVVIHSGHTRTGIDVVEWSELATTLGAGEILLTSWDRDGTRSGYDCGLVQAVAAAVNVPIVASGGAASTEDLAKALQSGADAVLAASIFHDGELSVTDVKRCLSHKGLEVRL